MNGDASVRHARGLRGDERAELDRVANDQRWPKAADRLEQLGQCGPSIGTSEDLADGNRIGLVLSGSSQACPDRAERFVTGMVERCVLKARFA
jgi:hypothetical protein